MYANSKRHDPYKNFNFSVSFIGRNAIRHSGWNFVSGIHLANSFQSYREGGNNGIPTKIFNSVDVDPVVLKRGMSEDMDIANLIHGSYNAGKGITRDRMLGVIIYVKDRDMKTVVRKITLHNVQVAEYQMGDLDSMGAQILLDQIVLVYEGIDYDTK